MIVSVFTSFTEKFVIRSYLITKMFRSLFSSSSRYRNWGPSESACGHCACPNPVPLLLATPLVIHEKNSKCLDVQAPGFPVAPKNHFHWPISLWTPAASLASHAIDLPVLLRVLHFQCFWFLLIYAAGFTVTPHSHFQSFGCGIFRVSADVKYSVLRWRCRTLR